MAIEPSGDTSSYSNGQGEREEALGVVIMANKASGGGGASGQVVAAAGVTPVDHSGTIAAANTAQEVMPADADRKGLWIQNVSTENLWINETGDATAGQPSMMLEPGALYYAPITGVPVTAISIIGATAGSGYSARSW